MHAARRRQGEPSSHDPARAAAARSVCSNGTVQRTVICHSSWMFGLAAPVVRAARATLVLWVHDRLSGRSWPERWARLTGPDLIVANSHFTAASVPSVYPGLTPSVLYAPVPPGPPDEPSRRSARPAWAWTTARRSFVIASRFEAWKGHRELLAAAARIAEPWRLWIAGHAQRGDEGAYQGELRSFADSLRHRGSRDVSRRAPRRAGADARGGPALPAEYGARAVRPRLRRALSTPDCRW